MEKYILTIQDMEELQDALVHLEVEYERIAKEGYESGSEQDGHHDEGFQLSKQSSEILLARMQNIREIIDNSRVIVPEEQDSVIKLGNVVIIQYEDDGTLMGVVISGYSGGISTRKKLSTKSKLGKSLLGKKRGDVVEVKLQTRTRKVKIVKIFPPSHLIKNLC